MATWRVKVTGDATVLDAFKNEVKWFKKLYSHGGSEAIFELPETDKAGRDELVAAAEKVGLKCASERYEDPLDSVDATADFW